MSGFNILKVYPELLDIVGLSERDRQHDLLAIFKRDIEDNFDFAFRSWRIYPIKAQGEADKKLIQAQAEADANKLLEQSITPELIELKRLEKFLKFQ